MRQKQTFTPGLMMHKYTARTTLYQVKQDRRMVVQRSDNRAQSRRYGWPARWSGLALDAALKE